MMLAPTMAIAWLDPRNASQPAFSSRRSPGGVSVAAAGAWRTERGRRATASAPARKVMPLMVKATAGEPTGIRIAPKEGAATMQIDWMLTRAALAAGSCASVARRGRTATTHGAYADPAPVHTAARVGAKMMGA